MKEFETYLFDWDGCLAKTLDLWMSTYLSEYKKLGFELSRSDVMDTSWGKSENGPRNVGVEDFEKCWKEIVSNVGKGARTVALYTDAKEILIDLKKRGKKLAIVTTSEEKIVMPALKTYGLDSLFDLFLAKDDVKETKPSPEIINLALETLGSSKEDTVIIGDTESDINAGHNAGIESILVLHDSNREFYDFDKIKNADPTYIVDSLIEILP